MRGPAPHEVEKHIPLFEQAPVKAADFLDGAASRCAVPFAADYRTPCRAARLRAKGHRLQEKRWVTRCIAPAFRVRPRPPPANGSGCRPARRVWSGRRWTIGLESQPIAGQGMIQVGRHIGCSHTRTPERARVSGKNAGHSLEQALWVRISPTGDRPLLPENGSVSGRSGARDPARHRTPPCCIPPPPFPPRF